MYYCLVRDEPEAAIVSVHRVLEDAIAERMVKEYEEALKRKLVSLEDRYYRECTYTIIEVVEEETPNPPLTFNERCKRLDVEYAGLFEKAKVTKEKADAAKALKEVIEREKKTKSQRAELDTFMAKWEKCDPDLKPLWLEKIKPIARAYLLNKDDPEVLDWMRTHYIL